ncbi:MAG: alkaline phosphatase D family protein [bacterium]
MFKTLTIFLILFSSISQAATIKAGPMPGANSLRTTRLWLQTDEASSVQIAYWPNGAFDQQLITPPLQSTPEHQFALTFDIALLEPGTTYTYQVLLDGKKALKQALHFKSQELWQWRHDAPEFTLMLGSCAYFNQAVYDRPGKPYGTKNGIFETMAQHKPDYMLWLGDNSYTREVDYTSPQGMAYRFQLDRGREELQSFLHSTQHLAIWDDHDYGPNNSNSSFIFKDPSLQLFKNYWPNPSYGLKELPGTFSIAQLNDVDVFMLDGRFYRDSDAAPVSDPDKALYGKQQMKWLKNSLLASTATFKLIAGGSQFFNPISNSEGWNLFPAEQQAFLDWLEQTDIRGLVFLSGDRHHTELMKIERENNYPLYELTCSPLTAGVYHSEAENNKKVLVQGTMVEQHNFCELNFSGSRKERSMNVKVFDAKGKMLWEKSILKSLLRKAKK